jgi:DNA-binding CsgD family transcriptional regulator
LKEESRDYQEKLHYKQLKQLLNNVYGGSLEHDVNQYIDKIRILEEFSMGGKRVLCLFSNPDFFIKYASKNIEDHYGYSPEEFYKGGLAFGFKLVYWKHFALPVKIFQWSKRYNTITKNVEKKETVNYFCGVKFRTKNGQLRTFFVMQKILTYDKNNEPILSFLELEDITNVYKKDFVWARFTSLIDNEFIARAFFTQGQRKEFADVLSSREMEILQLIAKHKTSIEISELLGITKNTVEKHRKNMIARTGVTDITALIYICHLCQML